METNLNVNLLNVEKLNENHIEDIQLLLKEQFGQEAWTKEQLISSNKSKSTQFYGIYKGNTLVCFASILCSLDDICLLDIATKQEFKNKGLAKKMLKFLIGLKKEAQSFSLEVKSKNDVAINLYKSFGFKTLSVRKKYYKDGDDALCMFLTNV